ncbi:MAG: alpha/beta fold hydrolase [Hyphomicrobiales bacterium]|nr:MAG: alpha/beta fold hydrolase [Hyphomicrobiales bacterium]
MSNFTIETPDGAVLHAFKEGHGQPLLLVSGLSGSAAFWSEIAATLSRSFQVIRFDQRGIGASTRGEAPCSIDLLAQDSLAVLDAAGVSRAVVLGHSTGGCIAQAIAKQAPGRLDGLILSASWLKSGRYINAVFGARRAVLATDPHAYAAVSVLAGYQPRWIEANWHIYDAALASAPVSEHARIVARERLDALLAFDRRAIMETGGHLFPISRPDAFTATVAEWIGEL